MRPSFVIESCGFNDGLWREIGRTDTLTKAGDWLKEESEKSPRVSHRVILILEELDPIGN